MLFEQIHKCWWPNNISSLICRSPVSNCSGMVHIIFVVFLQLLMVFQCWHVIGCLGISDMLERFSSLGGHPQAAQAVPFQKLLLLFGPFNPHMFGAEKSVSAFSPTCTQVFMRRQRPSDAHACLQQALPEGESVSIACSSGILGWCRIWCFK